MSVTIPLPPHLTVTMLDGCLINEAVAAVMCSTYAVYTRSVAMRHQPLATGSLVRYTPTALPRGMPAAIDNLLAVVVATCVAFRGVTFEG